MIQKFLIKAIPYIIIIVLLVIGYFWINYLKKDIIKLNSEIATQNEIIKQSNKTIEELKKVSETAQKEQEKDKEEHKQAQQELIHYHETIEQLVEEPADKILLNINKYNECIAKYFNSNFDCSKYLRVE